MPLLAPVTGWDPVRRRRVRRVSARLRPLLLPLAVVLAALVVAGGAGSPEVPVLVAAAPAPPAGRVLVAVTPADPAVLDLAVPGSRVDVYAGGGLDLGGAAVPGRRVADGAVVVAPGPPGGTGAPGAAGTAAGASAEGVLAAAGPATTRSVALAVTDDEAAALAGEAGTRLVLAVRAPPAPSPAGGDRGAGDG